MQTKIAKWIVCSSPIAVAALLALGHVAYASAPCKAGEVLDTVVEQYGDDLTVKLSRSTGHGPDAVGLSAKELRKGPGVADSSRPLHNPERMIRGTDGNAGLVPKEVGDKLSGREYRSFDEFRSDFWKTTAETRYAQEFSPSNRALMAQGKAPAAKKSQWVGAKAKYELHHINPIHQGGSVYDMSNLMITTPRFHREVLNRVYHYGD